MSLPVVSIRNDAISLVGLRQSLARLQVQMTVNFHDHACLYADSIRLSFTVSFFF